MALMTKNKDNPEASAVRLPRRKNPPSPPKGTITALDLDGPILRVAQGSSNGVKFEVRTVAAEAVELPEPKSKEEAKLAAAGISKALDKARIKPGQIVMGIGKGQAVLRPLLVPAVPDYAELASMIHFQIAKDLPFRLEDAVLDFTVLRVVEAAAQPPTIASGEKEAQPSAEPAPARYEVLVAAVRKEVVEFHKNVAAAAGLKLVGLGLRPHGHARALPFGGVGTPGAVGIVSVRQDESSIEIVVDGLLVFSRSANIPLPTHLVAPGSAKPETKQDGPADEAKTPAAETARFINGLVVEFVRSLHSYEGMMWHKPPVQIVVAGAVGVEQDLADALAKRLQLPVAVWNPQPLIGEGDPAPAVCRGSMATIGLAAGLGDADGMPIDFLNPKKPAAPRNTKQIRIMMAAAAALALLISLFAIRHHYVKKRLKIMAEVQEQVLKAEKNLPLYRKVKSQSDVVRVWMDEGQPWLDHWAYLTAVLPSCEEVYVSSVVTTSQRMIRLSLQAKTGEILVDLDKRLRAAGYEPKPVSVTPANDKYGYPFKTTVELVIPAKMKPDPKKLQPPPRPADDASAKTASAGSADTARQLARLDAQGERTVAP